MTNTINSDVIEKIRKLLSLSKRGGTQAEAELALGKAQEIAILHKIDLAIINTNEVKEKYEEKEVARHNRKPICQKFITWLLQRYFNVSVVYRGKDTLFIGKTSDIEIAKYVNDFLNREFMDLWRTYKSQNNIAVSSRNSYIYGLYEGLDSKLAKSKEETKNKRFEEIKALQGEEQSKTLEDRFTLIVSDDARQLRDAVKRFCPRLRTIATKVGSTRDYSALKDGRVAGSRININSVISNRSNLVLA